MTRSRLWLGGGPLGAAVLALGAPTVASARPPAPGVATAPAGCRLVLRGTGSYQLDVGQAGPVPVVTFKKATNPTFQQPRWEQGRRGSCNRPLGDVRDPVWSRNATPLLYTISTEINRYLTFDFAAASPQYAFVYQRLNDLNTRVTQGAFVRAVREGVAAVAAELISRYANPASFLTDKGAKWVAEQAIALMLDEFVAGRDPGLIIDRMLADMVKYLEGQADHVIKTVGGTPLQQALKPLLAQMAADLTKALVEYQPEQQSVRVTAYNAEDDCTHDYALFWNLKGGAYMVEVVIRCGEQSAGDVIKNTTMASATVDPGQKNVALTATALSQLGVAFPLGSATSLGIAAVATPAAEPAAAIAGPVATFTFDVADPKSDEVYPVEARLVTGVSTGSLAGKGVGSVTVRNVAPTLVSAVPAAATADPGGRLDLAPLTLTVRDPNGDGSPNGVREVDASSLTLAHPPDLNTTPTFDRGTPARRTGHAPAKGEFTFEVVRRTRVAMPHPHGTWPLLATMQDALGLTATTTVNLTVRDVPPVVANASAVPEFVHHLPRQPIDVVVRVTDANGFRDITEVRVDATAAGGGVYTLGNGLSVVGQDADWIDLKLETQFLNTTELGSHDIPVHVTDETGTVEGKAVLHVGNEAPQIGARGLLFDADSLISADDPSVFVLVPPKGLCPGDHFRAGLVASDPEGDTLAVTGVIVQTGATVTFRQGSERVWIGEMEAPPAPGIYTVRMVVREKNGDKSSFVEMPITVIDCGKPARDGGPDVALVQPANASDVAAEPRDQSSQLLFGEILGGIFAPIGLSDSPAKGQDPPPSGPSVEALLDSIRVLLPSGVPDGRPPVETYVLATGGSTGPVAQFFAINRSGSPVRIDPQTVVLEPVAISGEVQGRVAALLEQYVAAGGAATVLNAYCLEFLRQPPAAGTLLRLATPAVAAPFARYRGVLDAARRLRDAGALHPDSDPEGYFHATRQWAIWTDAEGFDRSGFEAAFLDKTRATLAEAGTEWTDELRAAVTELIPNRWDDVRAVLRASGLDPQ